VGAVASNLVDPARLERAKDLTVERRGDAWLVAGKLRSHVVSADASSCDCRDYEIRGGACKHILAVRRERGEDLDATLEIDPLGSIRSNGYPDVAPPADSFEDFNPPAALGDAWEPPSDDELVSAVLEEHRRADRSDAAPEGVEDKAAPNGGHRLDHKRLLEGEPPAPPSLSIDKFLLNADVNCFGAIGDGGKSVTIFTVSVCTVIGRPMFGTLAIKRPGPVVLVVPEDGEAVARHHVDAIIAGMGVSEEERAVLVRDLHIIGDNRRFNLLTDTRELAVLCEPIRPSVVALDPVASLIGSESENDEHVAEMACDNLRRDIARPLGSAILLAAHLRKPSRENGASTTATVHDLKGSSGWANHSRIVWILSKPKGSNLITYRLEKSNRLPTGIEHQVTLSIDADPENAAHWLTCSLTDANLGATSQSLTPGVGRAINENERKALNAIGDRLEPGARFANSRWREESGITSAETFRGVKDRLIEAGLAIAEPTGRMNPNGKSQVYQYGITDRGRAALSTGWVSEGVKL
jgi:hypothetical protein